MEGLNFHRLVNLFFLEKLEMKSIKPMKLIEISHNYSDYLLY